MTKEQEMKYLCDADDPIGLVTREFTMICWDCHEPILDAIYSYLGKDVCCNCYHEAMDAYSS